MLSRLAARLAPGLGSEAPVQVFVGLGNPGKRYAANRHNVGFMAVEAIARAHNAGTWRKRWDSRVAQVRLAGQAVFLQLPQTYINRVGPAVGQAMQGCKLKPQQVVVFHDELDLAVGRVRVKTGGGNGGHNGLRSLDGQIGKQYRRVRLGIGHPGEKSRVTGYVLGDFAAAEKRVIDPVLEAVAEHADLLVAGQDDAFMSKVAAARPETAAS